VGEKHVDGGNQSHNPTTAHARLEPRWIKTNHVHEVVFLIVQKPGFAGSDENARTRTLGEKVNSIFVPTYVLKK
jgi:hypothetical protein